MEAMMMPSSNVPINSGNRCLRERREKRSCAGWRCESSLCGSEILCPGDLTLLIGALCRWIQGFNELRGHASLPRRGEAEVASGRALSEQSGGGNSSGQSGFLKSPVNDAIFATATWPPGNN